MNRFLLISTKFFTWFSIFILLLIIAVSLLSSDPLTVAMYSGFLLIYIFNLIALKFKKFVLLIVAAMFSAVLIFIFIRFAFTELIIQDVSEMIGTWVFLIILLVAASLILLSNLMSIKNFKKHSLS